MLNFILLLFLFSFVFICKCVQGLCYYLRLFGNVFEVCVGIPAYLQVVCLDNIYVRLINKISKPRCRTIIKGYPWFGLSLLFLFLCNENTNYWIWIKQYYHSNQPRNKVQKLVFAWCSSNFYNYSFIFFLVLKVSLLLE